MYTAKIENANNEILTLTQTEERWQVVSITGLNPPAAQVNTTAIAGMDGAKFNSAKLNTRQIVTLLRLKGDVEDNRQYLYHFFRTKEWCKFYFKNANRDVFIEGRIETCEVSLFGLGEAMQVSIICPNPYFKSVDEIETELSSVTRMFYFPFAIDEDDPIPFSELDITGSTNIYNSAEADAGLIFTITFNNAASTLKLLNETTGETFELDYSFSDGDTVIINTNKGEKSVRLIRNAVEYNLFSALVRGSTFFQLQIGDNYFSYLADGGAENQNVFVTLSRYDTFRGV